MSRADESAFHNGLNSPELRGLSVREEFAKAALTGILAGNPVVQDPRWEQANALLAVRCADALIAALSREST